MESSILQNIPSNGLEIEKILSRTFRKYSIGDNKFIYISKTPLLKSNQSHNFNRLELTLQIELLIFCSCLQ